MMLKVVIKIGVNNEYNVPYTVVDGKYEYRTIDLDNVNSNYIYIPLSIILNTELDIRRVAVFSYLRIHCGLNNVINCTAPDIVEWCGGKPDRSANGSNNKVLSIMDALSDMGYLTYLTQKSRSSFMKCELDTIYCGSECGANGYAVVYLDEIDKIMRYSKKNIKDSTLNNMSILLVFAYLRNKIKRRSNLLKPEERSSDGIKKRRERIPDAFDCYIDDIAAELNMSSKTVSKIIDILEHDLLLIVTDRAFRVKNEDGEFRTLPTIFANAYKRDDRYLLDTGEDYSRMEIELKAASIQDYRINKGKRRIRQVV